MLCRLALKVAVILLPAIATVHVLLVPLQAPLQPPKVNPGAAVAVNVTCGLPVKLAVQVVGQSIPFGTLVTVPVPAPITLTVNWETPFTRPWHPAKASIDASVSTAAQVLKNIPFHSPF